MGRVDRVSGGGPDAPGSHTHSGLVERERNRRQPEFSKRLLALMFDLLTMEKTWEVRTCAKLPKILSPDGPHPHTFSDGVSELSLY